MNNARDAAVSEIIGAIMLVTIVVVIASVIGVLVLSQPPPQKIPSLSAVISNQGQIVYIKHDGGDPLVAGQYKILVDGTDVTSDVKGAQGTFAIGGVLSYAKPGTNPPMSVQVIYTGYGSSAISLASSYFGSTPGSVPAGTTPIPTPNTTTSAPVASFTGTPVTGSPPLNVVFTDSSTNTPTSWLWNFGDSDSTNATVQNPVHRYASAGTYTVSLTATNAGGSNTSTRSNYIVVSTSLLPPVSSFTATPSSGPAPLSVVFTDTSTNNPTSWAWTFGDGNSSTIRNPTYVYSSVGSYTVSLKVTNAAGSNTSTRTIQSTVSNFTNYTIQNSVFVYGTQLNFNGGMIYGDGATIVIMGPLSASNLNGGSVLAVSTIYVNGDVNLDSGSAGLGSPTSPGAIYVNGNMNLGSGGRDIYGNVSIAKNLNLVGARIHGNMYVNGDVTLGYTPTVDSNSNIYYTGNLIVPDYYNHPEVVARCIHQATVPGFTMPDLTPPPVKPDIFYSQQGYLPGGTLTSNTKIYADSYSSSSWGAAANNVIIIAKNGDITLNQGYGTVTGILFAPHGKVTFSGGSFMGVVIARDGFFVPSGGTTVTFTNIANYVSDPNNYPF